MVRREVACPDVLARRDHWCCLRRLPVTGEIVDAEQFRGEPVEAPDPDQPTRCEPPAEGGASWHTNQTNSVDGCTTDSEEFDDDRELPTPGDVVSSFYDNHYDLAKLPLTRQHGRSIRSELLEVSTKRETTDAPQKTEDPFEIEYVDGRNPVTWGEAVMRLVQDHEEKRNMMLHLARGKPGDPLHATFDTPAESRFMASYQKKYFAQLKACLREFVGAGERPSGESPGGIMENPKVVLLTRTASSIPDGDRLPVIDHFDQLRESWSDVRNTIRNKMEKDLGLDSGVGWVYDRRLEPHPGDGANQCYPHEHVVLLVDRADLTESDFRKVVEKHVDSCDAAGRGAHDLDVEDWDANRDDVDTVSIRDPAEIENLAAYVADYASIEPADLLERSTDYVAFAAAAWATSTQTITRSDPMVHASTADACKQRFEDGATDQELDHAEEIRREEIRGKPTLVCAECGSPHGIDQTQTLIEARSPQQRARDQLAADGGRDWDREREDELREAWPSARSVAHVGEQPTRTGREIKRSNESDEGNAITDRDIRLLLRALDQPVRRPEWMEDGWILEHDVRYQSDPDDPLVFEADDRAPRLDEPLPQIVVFINERHHAHPDRIDELRQQELAGYDPNERVVSVERPPEWRLDAVTVDGERHSVSSGGGGVDKEETKLSGDLLRDWVLEHTELEEMAADTGQCLNWCDWYQPVEKVAEYVADRAGASVERCEHVIDELVSVPSEPNPRIDPTCWRCDGSYEYVRSSAGGSRPESIFECSNCANRRRIG